MKKIALITFLVFMVEAIVDYNLGAKSSGLPPQNDLIRLALLVLVFSSLNAVLIKSA